MAQFKKMMILPILGLLISAFFCFSDEVIATPVYAPDNFENLVPSRIYDPLLSNKFKGLGVQQVAGVTPQLTLKYVNDDYDNGLISDPWQGGRIDIHWESVLKAQIGGGSLWTSVTDGFGFVAHVNLPREVLADDVLKAIIEETAVLTVSGKKVELQKANFEKIGNHTLRLTVRAHNAKDGLLWTLLDILTNLSSLDQVPVSFDISADVATLMQNGDPNDTSPNKILTKGKLPPIESESVDFSVDFYGQNDIVEGAVWGGMQASGYLYAKLDSDGNIPAKNRATATISSWHDYISPYDNKSEYNTITDTEVVAGSGDNLPGSIGSRILNPTLAKENFHEMLTEDSTRFNRVVNFFTRDNVTQETQLSYTPNQVTGINQVTPVVFSGVDQFGQLMSPVTLLVEEKYLSTPTIKVTNILPVTGDHEILTQVKLGDSLEIQAQWQAPDLKTGSVYYRLLQGDSNGKNLTPVPHYEEVLWQQIENGLLSPQELHTTLTSLPLGTYFIDTKIIDDYYPEIAKWQSEIASDQLPVFQVLDVSEFSLSGLAENMRTQEKGASITALGEDIIMEEVTLTVTELSNIPYEVLNLTGGAPEGTTLQKALLKTENGEIAIPIAENQFCISYEELLGLNESIILKVYYQVDQGLSNMSLTTIPTKVTGIMKVPTLSGVTQETELLIGTTPERKILLPADELMLLTVPQFFSFGENLKKPIITTKYPLKSEQLNFFVLNNQAQLATSDFTLEAKLTQPFQTSKGEILPNTHLNFINDGHEIEINQSVLIYQNSQNKRGEVTFSLNKNSFELEVAPSPALQKGVPYQGEITWQLTRGPSD